MKRYSTRCVQFRNTARQTVNCHAGRAVLPANKNFYMTIKGINHIMSMKKVQNKTGRRINPLPGVAALLMFYAAASWGFSFNEVDSRARSLASKAYDAPTNTLPAALGELKFADYQQIQFRRDKAYWGQQPSPFKLNFYHEGMYFNQPVRINEIVGNQVRTIRYSPDYFTFGSLKIDPDDLKKLGFAGFKILYPLNKKTKNDEFFSMLGASYFRAIGKGQVYGLSGRGLAIDTALPSGEEFPHFREFWLQRPGRKDKQIVLYALLDSPRATGAYRFTITPGDPTRVDVLTRIYLRSKVGKLGIAPLTSMYLFGAVQPSPLVNYRPELHDSDGLSIHAGNGEWIWRPLVNPKRLAVSAFAIENPRGFGLLQRERHFSAYQDLDDRYDLRPGGWVEPKGNWGKGHIELVEIPTADETNDNVVTYWVPEQQPAVGKPAEFAYRVSFTRHERQLMDKKTAWVAQTRRSTGEVKQANLIRKTDDTIAWIVDFAGPSLKALPASKPVTAQVSSSANGQIVSSEVRYNPVTRGRRLILRVKVKDPKTVTELRAALQDGKRVLTETWSHQIPVSE